MNATNCPRLPLIPSFRLLDAPNNIEDDNLKLWPLLIAVSLFLLGVYVVLRIHDDSLTGWRAVGAFGGVLAMLATFGVIMSRLQNRGHVWFNVERTRRGFRVVTKEKK